MKVALFSIHSFDQPFFEAIHNCQHQLVCFQEQLTTHTAHLAKGFDAVAIFTSDSANAEVLTMLQTYGVRFVALRSVGYDHIDLAKASELNIKVAHVPEYSPFAIAELTIAIMLL